MYLPFELGGAWAIQGTGSVRFSCTGSIQPTEIDGNCAFNSGQFSFTTSKSQAAGSILGDMGGTWSHVSTWSTDGIAHDCALNIQGSQITTCASGGTMVDAISVTINGDSISGSVQGGELAATRR